MEVQAFIKDDALFYNLECPSNWIEGETGITYIHTAPLDDLHNKEKFGGVEFQEPYKKRKGKINLHDKGDGLPFFEKNPPFGNMKFAITFYYATNMSDTGKSLTTFPIDFTVYYGCLLRKVLQALKTDSCSVTKDIEDFIFLSLIFQYLETLNRVSLLKDSIINTTNEHFNTQLGINRYLFKELTKLCEDCEDCKEIYRG